MIDWDLARATAGRFASGGPSVSEAEAADVVAELRTLAADAEGPVRDYTDLHAGVGTAPVLVVDRAGWAEANLATFEQLTAPLLQRLDRQGNAVTRAIGSRVTGVELGGMVAFLSSRVLGQFDPFWPGDGTGGQAGRLMLVAPNIVTVERTLGVDPRDFRAWVCLHEETHRVQFTAVPWMRDHVQSLLDEFIGATDVGQQAVSRLASQLTDRVGRVLKGEQGVSFTDLFQNERQQELIRQITGVMSLLEGHADVVMDGVGPQVIPSVDVIRRKFDQRRQGKGGIDRLIRSLLGLEAKMRQYRDGAEFVRAIEKAVGFEGFNAVWAGPQNLPTADEILAPDTWLARVHG